ncbi:3'-5' exonuclease [Rhodoferax sp. UBA5149]|uniref:3'-5' exonuclease n=1 Tax=Rhodoferax sp. UBA5149 TaxID=1947379 RepID=UPI0025F5121F|nr:3'-5' exonuclease [Rhodoferax sp. UBA5149]
MSDPQLPLGFDTADVPVALVVKPKTRQKTQRAPTPQSVAIPDAEAMAATLARHPDYRVLRRLLPVRHFDRTPQGPVVRVVVLDTETTGLDHARDKIIELAMLRVDVDTTTGLPVGDVLVYDELEDPGMPVSKEIQAITGISSEMVKGRHLDEARIATVLEGADLVIAHNAGFDRPFCEARIPAFAQLPWGCSFADIDWKKEGHGSAKLEYLAMEKGWFYDAHRAEVDCHALLAVLGEQLLTSKQSGLAEIIAASGKSSYRLQATGAPFEAKDLLKARSYRWNSDQKVWHTRLTDEAQLMAEFEWLKSTVYGGRLARVQVEKLNADTKYSSRAGELSNRQI